MLMLEPKLGIFPHFPTTQLQHFPLAVPVVLLLGLPNLGLPLTTWQLAFGGAEPCNELGRVEEVLFRGLSGGG